MNLSTKQQHTLSNIKLLVMDVDGTLTDGKIYVGNEGEIGKAFNVKDGYMLAKCRDYDIYTAIITGRISEIVSLRAKVLKITDVFQGITNKSIILNKIVQKHDLALDQVAYVGDDLNDLDCMKICGFSACPKDAAEEVISSVDYVCSKNGGDGAVRELIDLIIKARA